ncbi:SLATT domain-containing protein [Achromobacter sp. ACM02]|uniref:SLATT domain-containing protein n=1 Tax=Achromobacter sp. ACM02 TaxID=2769305 RepID=UPI00177C3EF0|nr:SLATT domain-containing protein [Achromobacter sp. ACM02]MBD9381146.1 SLATT domain-containing protein [Achromobacter sp. ACM02]
MTDLESFHKLAIDWYQRCATVAVGHYKTAELLSRRNRWLVGWSAGLSALVGTAVFSSIQAQPDIWLKVFTGFMSVAAAVLAALGAGFQYQDRAERHRVAGAKYNAVGRCIEQLLASSDINIATLDQVRERLDNLAAEMPHIPKNIHKEIAKYEDIGKWAKEMKP